MITITRSSSAVQQLDVSPATGEAIVTFKNGTKQSFINVDKAALENVLYNTTTSLGFFVNQELLGRSPAGSVVAR